MSLTNSTLAAVRSRITSRIVLDREAGDPDGFVAGLELAHVLVTAAISDLQQMGEKAPVSLSSDLPVLDCQFGIENAPSAVYSLLTALQHADHVGQFRMVVTEIK